MEQLRGRVLVLFWPYGEHKLRCCRLPWGASLLGIRFSGIPSTRTDNPEPVGAIAAPNDYKVHFQHCAALLPSALAASACRRAAVARLHPANFARAIGLATECPTAAALCM